MLLRLIESTKEIFQTHSTEKKNLVNFSALVGRYEPTVSVFSTKYYYLKGCQEVLGKDTYSKLTYCNVSISWKKCSIVGK